MWKCGNELAHLVIALPIAILRDVEIEGAKVDM
jgi:hypothetical protein